MKKVNMTKRTRLISFIIIMLLFLIAAPSICLYMQGYRLDFRAKKLTQTGGFYFKIMPRGSQISLGDKPPSKTDFLFGTKLIEDVLPGKYNLRIEKAGYWSWQKSLEIKEKQVTEIKNVVLIPENISFTMLAKNMADFWFSEGKVVFRDKTKKGDILQSLDPQTGTIAAFSPKAEPAAKKEVPLLPPKQAVFYQKLGQDIYYLDPTGYLYKATAGLEEKMRLNETPIAVLPKAQYDLNVFYGFTFLRENKTLFLFNPETKTFEKFFEPVNDLKLSPDGQKLVYFSDSEIWVLFLRERYDQPQKKAGDKVFVVRLSDKLAGVEWLNASYLIYAAPNRIKITEIDDRDRLNVVTISSFDASKILFNQDDKKLYLLADDILYASDKIIR